MTTAPCTLPEPRPPWWPFTPAEDRVAQLVAEGKTATQIAAKLGRSTMTVQSHIHRMARVLPGDGLPRARIAQFLCRAQRHTGPNLPHAQSA